MSTAADRRPETLRARMVDHVRDSGHARSSSVQNAMRQVPRHEFVPATTPEAAYADIAVITKRADDGSALSCASVPTVVAMMLDQLDVRSDDRILEIGAGTGYNAALLAHLTGPTGTVTTVDIDSEVTDQARLSLASTGYEQVQVITRDGALGASERAPYDRIIFTVGAWDLTPPFWSQLAPGGRLVVPLRWRGQTRSVAFVRDDARLISDSVELCGFVPMIGEDGERTGHIDAGGQVALFWDLDQDVDLVPLRGVLDLPRVDVWSRVTVRSDEPFDGVWLRMTATEPGVCRIAAGPAATAAGRCRPAIPSRSPALTEDGSLAYFTYRRLDPGRPGGRSELGAYGHGPAGQRLAERICENIRAWDGDRAAHPVITVYPTDSISDKPAGSSVIMKSHTRLAISL
jgi:protein-L-isoaspartate(D-aspartate) O-methyltransferase